MLIANPTNSIRKRKISGSVEEGDDEALAAAVTPLKKSKRTKEASDPGTIFFSIYLEARWGSNAC